jgi:hypothetical protein
MEVMWVYCENDKVFTRNNKMQRLLVLANNLCLPQRFIPLSSYSIFHSTNQTAAGAGNAS